MLRAWSVVDIRAAEQLRFAEVPDGALMQRAAAGLATVCLRELRVHTGGASGRRAVLLVGAGNNGGDALFAGQRLAARGVKVDAVLLAGGDRVHAAGLAALLAAGGRVLDPDLGVPAATDLVIDGIVGLGGSAGLRENATRLVAALPAGTCVVAVDLPSGVDPDTGELPDGDSADGDSAGGDSAGGADRPRYVTADVTVTFGAYKGCLLLPPASQAAGRVELVDIGLGPLLTSAPLVERLEAADGAARWPVPRDLVGAATHKYTRGVLGVCAGSDAYPGAAVLASAGALRAGVGMLRYVGPPEVTRAVLSAWPEAVAGVGRVQAWLVGSGLDPRQHEQDGQHKQDGHGEHERHGEHDEQLDVVRRAISGARDGGPPTVVDAGALSLLAEQLLAEQLLAEQLLAEQLLAEQLLADQDGDLDSDQDGDQDRGLQPDESRADESRAGGPAGGGLLLTPHAGELATLLTALGRPTEREQVESRPLHHARIAAELTGATVLLKGSTTLVVEPPSSPAPPSLAPPSLAPPSLAPPSLASPSSVSSPGRVRSQADATPWLATAGAGDVLAGIAGALLAGGLDPLDAGSLAALVHGRAARAASRGGPITAGDVAESVPHAVRDLSTERITR